MRWATSICPTSRTFAWCAAVCSTRPRPCDLLVRKVLSSHSSNTPSTTMPLNNGQPTSVSQLITLLPEFHLTGFHKGSGITQAQAEDIAQALPGGVVVAGYVEEDDGRFYSSAIVLDGLGGIHHVRKSAPWGRSERSWMSGSGHAPPVLELAIGRTIVILCVDAFETRFGATHRAQETWGSSGIDWVLVPSCWPNDIHRYLIRRGVWRLARAVGGAQWMVRDKHHGRIRSEEWESKG